MSSKVQNQSFAERGSEEWFLVQDFCDAIKDICQSVDEKKASYLQSLIDEEQCPEVSDSDLNSETLDDSLDESVTDHADIEHTPTLTMSLHDTLTFSFSIDDAHSTSNLNDDEIIIDENVIVDKPQCHSHVENVTDDSDSATVFSEEPELSKTEDTHDEHTQVDSTLTQGHIANTSKSMQEQDVSVELKTSDATKATNHTRCVTNQFDKVNPPAVQYQRQPSSGLPLRSYPIWVEQSPLVIAGLDSMENVLNSGYISKHSVTPACNPSNKYTRIHPQMVHKSVSTLKQPVLNNVANANVPGQFLIRTGTVYGIPAWLPIHHTVGNKVFIYYQLVVCVPIIWLYKPLIPWNYILKPM